MDIFTIGDSHSKYGWNRIGDPDFRIIITHLGPVLAHSIMRDWRSRIRIRPERFSKGCCVIFHFGEIDCRCHIGKRPDPLAALNGIVPGYLAALAEASRMLEAIVAVCTVPPPPSPENCPDPAQFPVIGSSVQRAGFVKIFNELIACNAEAHGLQIFDPASFVTDEDGYLVKKYSSDGVHVDDPSILLAALKKLGLSPPDSNISYRVL